MRTLLTVVLLLSSFALGEEPRKLKGSKKDTAPKVDLGLPAMGNLPTDQKLQHASGKPDQQQGPSAARADEGYSVVRVVHGKGFIKSPEGSKPSTPFPSVTATPGNPWQTEKFSSIVRVKNPAKKNTSIEIVFLDQRGDTVMDATGQLRFPSTGDEAEWQVDWEPSSIRNPGEFQVLVRVGGNPLGTFPVTVAAAPTK